MKLKLFVGSDCPPCQQAEEGFKRQYAEELASGEAEIINLEQDQQAQEFWLKHELPVAPVAVAVSNSGKLLAVMEVENLIESGDKEPATA